MLDARRLDLEWADAIPGGDDHVVGAPRVPVVTVLVALRRVLGVEPVAPEGLRGRLRVVPVAERIVGIGAGAEADLTARSPLDGVLVLVEDLYVPAGHRLAHRALADLHERVVAAERIGLAEAVVVEHCEAVLRAEP